MFEQLCRIPLAVLDLFLFKLLVSILCSLRRL
jgi:hypothetical protein